MSRSGCFSLLLVGLTAGFVMAQAEQAAPPAAGAAQGAPPAAATEPAPAPSPWESEFELGLSGSRGTTLSTDGHAAFRTKMKTDLHRLMYDAIYNYGSTDGVDVRNDFTTGVVKDWFLPGSPWFGFADARYDYDDFGSWRQRFSGHGGVGIDLVREEEIDLTLRTGAGAYEALDDQRATQYEALIGGNTTWRVTKGQELGLSSTLYPGLNDFATDYRWVSSAYWKLQIAYMKAMSVKFGIDHEYESAVSGNGRHHDIKFYGAVVIAF